MAMNRFGDGGLPTGHAHGPLEGVFVEVMADDLSRVGADTQARGGEDVLPTPFAVSASPNSATGPEL